MAVGENDDVDIGGVAPEPFEPFGQMTVVEPAAQRLVPLPQRAVAGVEQHQLLPVLTKVGMNGCS